MTAGQREEQEAMAMGILQSYNVMGCDLMNVGSKDLGAGLDFIKTLKAQANFPMISANIQAKDSGQLLFPPSAILSTQDKKLGFVGVSSGDGRLTEFDILDPLVAANKEIEALRDEVDLVFLLASVDDAMEQTLLAEVKGVDFFIRSHTPRRYQTPKIEHDMIVVKNGSQGKYAGVLEVKQIDRGASLKDISAQKKRIKFADTRLSALHKDVPDGVKLEVHFAGDENRLKLIERLRGEKQDNLDLIEKLNNTFYFEAIALDTSIEDSPEVAPLVAEWMENDAKNEQKH